MTAPRPRTLPLLLPLLALLACGDDTRPPTGGTPGGTAATNVRLAAVGTMPAEGFAGEPVRPPATVIARVAGVGPGRPGIPVRWAIARGGGTVSTADTVTAANGTARAVRWVLGDTGVNVLLAIAGADTVRFEARASTRPPTGWEWRFLGAPLGETGVLGVLVDPTDSLRRIAVIDAKGLLSTTDGGATWRWSLEGDHVYPGAVRFDPRVPGRVWAMQRLRLMVSEDGGARWTERHRFAQGAGFYRALTLLVSARDGAILVPPQWEPQSATAPGVLRSRDEGRSFTLLPYGVRAGTQVLSWDVLEDPRDGTLWISNEIADHPQPYHPPLFRSRDDGRTWTDLTRAPLPWHVVGLALDTADNRLFALSEGAGLFTSADRGDAWAPGVGEVGISLLHDHVRPRSLYIGAPAFGILVGGVWVTRDAGATVRFAGLADRTVGGMSMDGAGRTLHVAVYREGLWAARIP